MAFYEHTFLVRPDATPQQVEALVETFKGVIETNGGKVQKVELWGLKTTASRIKKNRKAYYAFMNIDAPSAAIAEMERQESINEDILRTLTVRVKELETDNSVMMQKKDRDDRKSRRRDDDSMNDLNNTTDEDNE